MSDQPLPPPPDPDAIDDLALQAEHYAPKSLRSCSPILLIGIVAIILLIVAGTATTKGRSLFGDDDPSPSGSASASPSASESPSESTSQPATGGEYAPPAKEDLPPGAVLYTGNSGDQIGCIACDGQFRFLHVNKPGVGVGDAGRPAQEVVWDQDGAFVEFGANISGKNKGRYGYNLFADGTTNLTGCSMDIGQTSCRQQTTLEVKKGQRITIAIGEAGIMVDGQIASMGEFTVTWWFVFQPAS